MAHLQAIVAKECFDTQFSLDSMDLYLSFLGEDIANEMGRAILAGTIRDNWMEDPTFREDYTYAIMALAGTVKVVTCIHLMPSNTDKALVRSKILSGIQGILAWILVCHHQPPKIPAPMRRKRTLIRNDMRTPFIGYLTLVDTVFDLHPSARVTLLNTPLALDVVLFFWDAIDEDGQPCITYQPYKQLAGEAAATTSCAVLNLFVSFLRYGREFKAKISLLNRIEEGRTSDAHMWLESAIMRIKYVVEGLRDDPRQPRLAATTFVSTLAFGTGILFVTASSRTARAAMEKRIYEQLTGALHALSLRHPCPSTSPEILTESLLLRQRDMILWLVTGQGGNYVRGMSGMLENGLLENIVRGATTTPGSTPHVDQIKSALNQLTFYSIYPTVLKQVVAAIDHLAPSLHSEFLSRAQLPLLWNPFQETVKFYKRHLDTLPRKLNICDNLHVRSSISRSNSG